MTLQRLDLCRQFFIPWTDKELRHLQVILETKNLRPKHHDYAEAIAIILDERENTKLMQQETAP